MTHLVASGVTNQLIFLLFTFMYNHIQLTRFFFSSSTHLGHIEAHLRYPHCWVWLTASQLFGQLFAAHQAEQLVAVWRGEGGASSKSAATDFITNNLDKKVKPWGGLVEQVPDKLRV